MSPAPRIVRRCAISAGLCAILASVPASADLTSTFDAGNDGWSVVSYPFRSNGTGGWSTAPLTFDGGEGLPAGSVRVGDVFAETGITAPASYLGDRHTFYGGSLSYDIFLRYSDGVTYPAVVLVGTMQSLYYDAPSPVVGAWEPRSVPLTEAGWKIGGTTTPATEVEFQAVLQSLLGLHIYTEWHTGTDDTNVDNVVLRGGTTPVTDVPGAALAVANYPNPFNPRTTIRFQLAGPGRTRLSLFDMSGRLVRTLVESDLDAGSHEVVWDGCDAAGVSVGSGKYLARVQADRASATVGLLLIR